MFVLFNMWNANHAGLASDVEAIGNEWLQLVMRSFRTFKVGLYMLEEVRDHTRRKLHRDLLTVFVYGHETGAEAVMLKMMTSPTVFASIAVCCDNGHSAPLSMQHCCVIEPTTTGQKQWTTLQQYIDITSTMPLTAEDSVCQRCTSAAYKKYTYEIVPPILAALVTFSRALVNKQIQLTIKSNIIHYNLAGVVYYRDARYTARFVDTDGHVWYNNGLTLGRRAQLEGFIYDMDMMKDRSGKSRNILIYRRT
ncbi:hypothetical protein ARMGADRAFT_1092861 [Armillaria gallica]|uniref:Uncharacterized protein n=1 Tax=Armillaria gallica TaxID=47427 RepID=A0A2H3CJS1_ARMGA|nr:hypothetical protein ARMGADRAFT_1093143 [Armillaria gallica]PBK79744.1 hypothetical protein ARMGADRAFT_1092861 [Armillaria gallica]